MMGLFSGRSCASIVVLSAALTLCWGWAAQGAGGSDKDTAGQVEVRQSQATPAAKQPVAERSVADANVVAEIGDYVVTRDELEKRLMMSLRPYDYETFDEAAGPPDAKTILLQMVAEKAMIMDARKQGFAERETVKSTVDRYRDRKLVNRLLQEYLKGRLSVSEAEIQQHMKANPKLDRARATQELQRAKANAIMNKYYEQVYERSNVKKLSENFAQAAKIHDRLLNQPKEPRKVGFILNSQMENELTQEEKDLVLATFRAGKLTLKDWFGSLNEIAPPGRPRDLGTPEGVERLLDRALRMPLLIAEAESIGLDKDKELLRQVREYEDGRLLGEARLSRIKDVNEPGDEEVKAYFAKNKEVFTPDRSLKVDQIWCVDRGTADKARAELAGGKDFDTVKKSYSLTKESEPSQLYPGAEAFFWKDLWKAEAGELLGPMKGFFEEGFKWRLVKILEKKPGKAPEYSEQTTRRVRSRIMAFARKALLDKYQKELLEKYPHRIHAERIKGIDPLDIR